MNIFFSGIGGKGLELDPRLGDRKRYRLLSCHGAYKRSAYDISEECCAAEIHGVEFMYDSGAFTAWSKGEEITLDELIPVYADLLRRYGNRDVVEAIWLINLDKIPGEKGRTATPAELDEAIAVSDHNYDKLVSEFGPCILPVFHQNEDDARLEAVAKMGGFICVSPRNDLPEMHRMPWAKEVHRKIAAIGERRTHGLAATGFGMMHNVPWWSVDSATWVILGANGAVFVDDRLKIVQVSDQSGAIKDFGNHFRTLPALAQHQIRERVEAKGFTIEELETRFEARMLYNRITLIDSADVAAKKARAQHIQMPSFFGL